MVSRLAGKILAMTISLMQKLYTLVLSIGNKIKNSKVMGKKVYSRKGMTQNMYPDTVR
jgi:uncharacterized membrane protein YbjE (DUF340 family)